MNKSILIFAIALLLFSCENNNSKGKEVVSKVETKKAIPDEPFLHVYNMGGAPSGIVSQLVDRLKAIYPNTEYSGELSFVDSAYIKNDKKGDDRYWWSKLRPHMIKTTDTKRGISLVVINAEVCNWDKKNKDSHANLGISNLGGHVSFVSYQRLKKNRRDNVTDMLKIAVHELGHSVGGLVPNRGDDGSHCPNKHCLMVNAKNHFPYTPITGFCESCDKVMRSKGFETTRMGFKQ